MHLSRLAEEIVIWTSPLTGLMRLSDKFTTGSSIMPQKRNPDAAELVRAKAGRIAGAFQAIVIVMKGLPLAYQKDMQEDKEGAMDALAALSLCIAAMTGMVRDIEPDIGRMKKAAGEGYATATDLADWLVRTLNIPFRQAHHITGSIVAQAAKDGVPLHRVPLAEMQTRRTGNHRRRVQGAVGRSVGAEPDQLWRNRSEKCPAAGQALVEAAGQGLRLRFFGRSMGISMGMRCDQGFRHVRRV